MSRPYERSEVVTWRDPVCVSRPECVASESARLVWREKAQQRVNDVDNDSDIRRNGLMTNCVRTGERGVSCAVNCVGGSWVYCTRGERELMGIVKCVR